MKTGITIFLILSTSISVASVNFNRKFNLSQIKSYARENNSYILLDFIATWCGPCKAMDNNVYADSTLGNFMNAHFISVKVQIDQTNNDDEYIKSWYKDAKALMREYNVTGFPTMVFLTPDGQLAGKAVGYQSAVDLLAKAKAAMDSNQQYATQLNKYLAGDHSPALIKLVSSMGDNVGRTIMARKIQRTDELSMKGIISAFIPTLNYSGKWQLDTTATDFHDLPKNVLLNNLNILQTNTNIKVDRISQSGTATETLDYSGKQLDIPLVVSGRIKKAVLFPDEKNNLVEYAEYTYPGSAAELEYVVKETWVLAADKQTLNVERQVKDNNGGYTVTGVYRKH